MTTAQQPGYRAIIDGAHELHQRIHESMCAVQREDPPQTDEWNDLADLLYLTGVICRTAVRVRDRNETPIPLTLARDDAADDAELSRIESSACDRCDAELSRIESSACDR